MNTGIAGVHKPIAKTDEWLTPPRIIKNLGRFDLDPCAAINQPWSTAEHHYTVMDDGLLQPWFGRVWCNPPYGKETGRWLDRLSIHGNGIALTFARTETKMFFRYVWPRADAVLFIKGRLHFYDINGQRAPANSGGPSILIAYGYNNVNALKNCDIEGKLLEL